MLYKTCELCGKSFECFSDEGDCFCQNCLYFLRNNNLIKNQAIRIKTIKGEMKLSIKKKSGGFIINIDSKDYHYPLLIEKFQNNNDALSKFFQYRIKLENNKFKIIRNIEALDENYRRVFSRVKYSILF